MENELMIEAITKFEDVSNMTTEEYFNGNKFSIDAFNKKYAQTLPDGSIETYVQALKRVCDYIASAEDTEEKQKYWSERWFDEIFNDWWHPAGSIMQGADSGRSVSLSNCTTISLGSIDDANEWDSLESIIKNTSYTVAKAAAFRQGLGVDFSRIRPRGLNVLNSSNESQGAIHWMKLIDSLGYYIGQKGRIPAMLFSISVNHPDVEEFIQVKSDYTKIQNANISVQTNNAFYKAVEEDGDWNLEYVIPGQVKGQRIYVDVHSIDMDCKIDENGKWYKISIKDRKEERILKTVKARDLMELIAKNMTNNAEPGIQQIDMARYWSNSDYVYDPNDEYDSRIISTNAPFVGDTLVETVEFGLTSIKNLYNLSNIGEKISIFTNTIVKGVLPEIISVQATFKKFENLNVWKIVLENGDEFACSAEHKWWIRGKMIETQDIHAGNELAYSLSKGTIKFVKIKEVHATEEFSDMFCAVVPEYHSFLVGENSYLTSNCSEQYLSRESLCVLGSINVARFSTNPSEYDVELKKIAYSVNRFLDNVNEMEVRGNTYATPHQRLAILKLRRTGAGITNMAGWLFKNNLEYGSKEGNSAVSEFNRLYNFYLYESSITLGHEKGSFGLFNREKYEQSPFIQNMMNQGLVFDAMRNVTCSSIAPTGTLTLQFRDSCLSYGVEPAFGIYFWKRTRISGKYEYYFCVPSIVREVFKNAGYEIPMTSDAISDTWDGQYGRPIAEFIDTHKDKIGIQFKNATEVNALDKLDLMAELMKHCDSSISVTYTLPENATWKDTYDLIMEANRKGVKSIAAFPDRKMYGIVSFIPFKDLAVSLKSQGVELHSSNFCKEESDQLNISQDAPKIVEVGNAPKRPKELDADIYVVTVKGQKYVIAVGLYNGVPYEMFGGLNNSSMHFKFTHKTGKIIKVKQGHYKLEIGEDISIDNFGDAFTATEQILFRMVSTSLRHGIPIKFVVEQLNKAADDISSLSAASSRVLKKYIKDGEKAGGKCPSCGSHDLIYGDGCVSCSICSWTKCS